MSGFHWELQEYLVDNLSRFHGVLGHRREETCWNHHCFWYEEDCSYHTWQYVRGHQFQLRRVLWCPSRYGLQSRVQCCQQYINHCIWHIMMLSYHHEYYRAWFWFMFLSYLLIDLFSVWSWHVSVKTISLRHAHFHNMFASQQWEHKTNTTCKHIDCDRVPDYPLYTILHQSCIDCV